MGVGKAFLEGLAVSSKNAEKRYRQKYKDSGVGRETATMGNSLYFSGSKSLRYKENWIISSGRSWPCGDPVGASQKPKTVIWAWAWAWEVITN